MNISQIYEKEKEYLFFKLISERNVKGLIKKEHKEYKIKAYIDYQRYNFANNNSKNVSTQEYLTGVVRIPTLAVNLDKKTEKIEISNGDYIIFDNKKYEIIQVKKIKDESKEYYSFYLTDYIENIEFDIHKTELNELFYEIFKSLGIEAFVYHSFFQNSYFEKVKSPFLTYEITQINSLTDFKTKKKEIMKEKNIIFRYTTNRTYNMMINLYDDNQILNLDTILSKNTMIEIIMERLNIKFKNISDFELQELSFLSESDTIVNNKFLNQKTYNLRFTVDTFFEQETDYIENVAVNGRIYGGK